MSKVKTPQLLDLLKQFELNINFGEDAYKFYFSELQKIQIK
jgi:hypothetical protein